MNLSYFPGPGNSSERRVLFKPMRGYAFRDLSPALVYCDSSVTRINGGRPIMRHMRWTGTVLFLLSSLCYPQDATPTDPETIGQLVQQVKDLQERVKLLESQQNHANAST